MKLGSTSLRELGRTNLAALVSLVCASERLTVGQRARAIEALASLESNLATTTLITLLKDREPVIKEAAIYGLGARLDDELARAALSSFAEDPRTDALLRDIATETLADD